MTEAASASGTVTETHKRLAPLQLALSCDRSGAPTNQRVSRFRISSGPWGRYGGCVLGNWAGT